MDQVHQLKLVSKQKQTTVQGSMKSLTKPSQYQLVTTLPELLPRYNLHWGTLTITFVDVNDNRRVSAAHAACFVFLH